jgi:hypothetical protein
VVRWHEESADVEPTAASLNAEHGLVHFSDSFMNLCGLAVNERISGAWLDFHVFPLEAFSLQGKS